MTIQHTIEYTLRRCADCGLFWGAETNQMVGCPRCYARKNSERWAEICKLEKRIQSLKGVITRMKKDL